MDKSAHRGKDGKIRCWWCGDDPLYQHYHDTEWGRPCFDDRYIFEKLCLEGFQAGLSWITILRKRENFREAFANFNVEKVAGFTEKDVERLLKNEGIIRHRGKIEATINNARRAIELLEEQGSLSDYVWRYKQDEGTRPEKFNYETLITITQTEESKALSKDLKKRGWKFVGPTTIYAFMQSIGMVNDHADECFLRKEMT